MGIMYLALREEMRFRRLAELEQERSAMLAVISHRLRTPLTSLKWYTEILQETGKLTKEQMEKFAKKCTSLALEIYPLISNYFIKSEDVNKKELFCIDCSYKNALPSKLDIAKDFWKSLSEIKEENILQKEIFF